MNPRSSKCSLPLLLLLVSCLGGGDGSSGNASSPSSNATSPASSSAVPTAQSGQAPDRTALPDWLYTEGNRIKQSDGSIWFGRGANLHDTRSCNACQNEAPHVDEVMRRADALLDDWGANFVHFVLDSFTDEDAQQSGWVHWRDILKDPQYKDDVVKAV